MLTCYHKFSVTALLHIVAYLSCSVTVASIVISYRKGQNCAFFLRGKAQFQRC
jgi:hypothetical protein